MSSKQESAEGNTCAETFQFVSWFEVHGGSIIKLRLEDLGGEMGLGLITKEAIRKGETVMSVPRSICMTTDSVSTSRQEYCGVVKLPPRGFVLSLLLAVV